MKEDQLTPWFPAEVKPVHVGLYEVCDPKLYASGFKVIWDGHRWVFPGNPEKWLAIQDREWRGLRSKP